MAAAASASASSASPALGIKASGMAFAGAPTAAAFVPTLRMMPEVKCKDGAAPVSVVVASTPLGGIGMAGKLPWDIRTDMSFFRDTTKSTRGTGKRNAVIMGRRTWSSIPAEFRPLKDRANVVLSHADAATVRIEESLPENVTIYAGLAQAIESIRATAEGADIETIHIIGGASAFTEAVATGVADVLYVTEVVDPEFETDVTMHWPPRTGTAFHKTMTGPTMKENGASFRFTQWVNTVTATASAPAEPHPSFSYSTADGDIPASALAAPIGAADYDTPLAGELETDDATRNALPDIAALAAALSPGSHPEQQYLALIRDIICTGVRRGDRTGTGTLSKFGVQLRFSLRDGVLPLLTTKRVFWRGVAEELLWFVSGDTSARTLQGKDIHIWDGNGSREFLDKTGLGHREEGDLGPVYGFQWRHFGASYTDMHADYSGQGVDQLRQVVETIKSKPNDRRIILTAWNPAAIPEMALPPCHMFAQFFVANGELSCQMYQRSADMGLGVPFNIASYALLTHMLAHVTGLVPGDFVHVIGDAHVYLNHVAPLREQLTREPRAFPKLCIKREVVDIDDFKYEDFEVAGYKPHKTIKMQMAV